MVRSYLQSGQVIHAIFIYKQEKDKVNIYFEKKHPSQFCGILENVN